jgi:imidazolonepropionase-like amidohydrolase
VADLVGQAGQVQEPMMQTVRRMTCVVGVMLAVAALACLPDLAWSQTPPAGEVVVLKARRLFDGRSGSTVANGVIVVQQGKITAAGAGLAVPQGATVIDLGDATLLPGFIDAHTHLTMEGSPDWNADMVADLRETVAEKALVAAT